MTRAEEFEELRPLLFAIAYRILGSVSEAEDAVQETWLRYEASPTEPTSTKAFLSAVVTRISIDVLRSARLRREEYVGQWFPEPLLADPCGAQRLPNGNTLICEGSFGRIFEVTMEREVVWEYVNPFFVAPPLPEGSPPANRVFRAYRYPRELVEG